MFQQHKETTLQKLCPPLRLCSNRARAVICQITIKHDRYLQYNSVNHGSFLVTVIRGTTTNADVVFNDIMR